ncbi:FecR family protein [Achromobacter aegrifaciens]
MTSNDTAARRNAAREAAIEWQLNLSGGEATDSDRSAFDAWLAADPLHRDAWRHLSSALDIALHRIDRSLLAATSPLRQSLVRPQDVQRRRLGRMLLTGGVVLAGVAWTDRYVPLRHLAAEFVTGTGQRRRITLPDGSLMELDARSAANIDFSAGRRIVRMKAGAAIFETVSPHGMPGDGVSTPRQPLRVLTAHGEIQLQEGRALLQCESDRSFCVSLAGDTEIITRNGIRRRLTRGQGAWFDASQVASSREDQAHVASWRDGLLEVHDEPLHRVADALSRYRPGWIRVSPAAGRLRISGLFPLDDTERALEALRHTVPITLRRFGQWYVMIDVATARA